METSLPTPMTARVYVNLPEGIFHEIPLYFHYQALLVILSPGNVNPGLITPKRLFNWGWYHLSLG